MKIQTVILAILAIGLNGCASATDPVICVPAEHIHDKTTGELVLITSPSLDGGIASNLDGGTPDGGKHDATAVLANIDAGRTAPVRVVKNLGTGWHPDPDGDGIEGEADKCPYMYNPGGISCTLNDPVKGGPVTDLHAEHVTPYGAWLSFKSPLDAQYGWSALVFVSRNKGDFDTVETLKQLEVEGNVAKLKVRANHGYKVPMPVIFHTLEPSTTYYATVRFLDYRGVSTKAGNVLEFKTHAPPTLSPTNHRPRALLDPKMLGQAELNSSDLKGIEKAVIGAASKPNQYNHDFCVAASVLSNIKGDQKFTAAAKTILNSILIRWESISELKSANAFRWADSLLSVCTDLMWAQLSKSEKERNVRAFLAQSEKHLYAPTRFVDSDEVISQTRSAILDGIVACNSSDIDKSLSDRGCKLLKWGKQMMYGVALVKARRDVGFWAQSGGQLPDGSYYHQGSSTYWIQMLLAAHNAGGNVAPYAAWVKNNLRSVNVHGMTPSSKGYYSYGDVESYKDSLEPGSLPVRASHGKGAALRAVFLSTLGHKNDAALAAKYERNYAALDNNRARAYRWPVMVYGNTSAPSQEEPKAYHASGMGYYYDRTSWKPDASFLTFQAGWNGVDHSHSDNGHFQLYRRGNWLTHESLSYVGEGAKSGGHNVLQLQVDGGRRGPRVDQYHDLTAGGGDILRVSSSSLHSYVSSDLTQAYRSYYYNSYRYPYVKRKLFWLKSSNNRSADIVIVVDEAKVAEGVTTLTPEWHLNLPVVSKVEGKSATAIVGVGDNASKLVVTSIWPETSLVSVAPPAGLPSQHPGQIYTHRVKVKAPFEDNALHMVTVLSADSAGSTNAVKITPVKSSGTTGVVIGDTAVLFGTPTGSITLEVVPKHVWWTGLTPNKGYKLEIESNTLTLVGGVKRADSGGVLKAL